MAGSVGAYGASVKKAEGRRPLERSRHRWEDNIKMNLQEVGWGHGLHRSGSGHRWRALVNAVMILRVP